ncbi:NADH-ubiquinone oxidoreductase-G iron-sulfur binding region family protein [Mycobacterium ulcerans str. Harvey]|uniref:NADH-ubiquinone oxidoreductase-G iron-sulfur binding region family protein n=1 Tax=Mycobacterium ulcerans str. Harvey TaxID=1299332 RepID=A0ABN0RA96_MYCUL|nr:NADH-ubiquinone oxidoreductase-G iron-sulfur binding region family protein [Mycobacterium ulcerans str. Harvey]
MCDKGGECPLQNQAMSNGQPESRFTDVKRTFAKPINISAQVCWTANAASCAPGAPGSPTRLPGTRSSTCRSGRRPAASRHLCDEPFDSYFSSNTVQICPLVR